MDDWTVVSLLTFRGQMSQAGRVQITQLFDTTRPDTSPLVCADSGKPIPIPLPLINDDYCDCKDGSDEPGTSACAPQGFFWCKNKGHEPARIPSSRVRDGICGVFLPFLLNLRVLG